jgi:hypothetical protein
MAAPTRSPCCSARFSSHDIKTFVEKLTELDGAHSVQVAERKRGEQL